MTSKKSAKEQVAETEGTQVEMVETILDLPFKGTLTDEALSTLYPLLAAPLPEEAIQHANTKAFKGYDTTGVGYQYVINRMNDILGPSHWRTVHEMDLSGEKPCSAVCKGKVQIGNWVNGEFQVLSEREGYGNHDSKSKGDAEKGAYTNFLKKVASGFGVGRQAYEGTLDEDFLDEDGNAPENQVGGKSATFFNSNKATTPAPTPKADNPKPAVSPAVKPVPAQPASNPGDVLCAKCGKKMAAMDVEQSKKLGVDPVKCWQCRKEQQ